MNQDSCTSWRIRQLNAILLDNGKWVHSHNTRIHFPTSGGIDISGVLDLNLVDGKYLRTQAGRSYFHNLVRLLLPERIFSRIQPRHTIESRSWDVNFQGARFLFWHHGELAVSNHQTTLCQIITRFSNRVVFETSIPDSNGSKLSESKRLHN